MEAKNLTEGERKYMDETVGDHDRLNFYAWVDKKKDKKVEKRLMVVTDHRLLSIKRKVTGNKTVRRNGHFYDLVSLDCTTMDKVKVTFSDFTFEFEGNLAFQAVNAISNAVNVLYHDFPDTARPQVNLCEEMEDKLKVLSKKHDKPAGGYLLEHYTARCSFLKTAPNLVLQQYIKTFCEGDVPHLQLSECPGIRLKGSKELDLKPLFMALRHNTFVESILLEAVPKKDLMVLIADAMAANETIHTLHLIQAELGDNGWTEFGAAIKSNVKSKITDYDFSKNKLSNRAATALSIGLKNQTLGVKNLKFGSCELKPKGLTAIIDSISSNKVHWTSLEELDLSGNSWDDSVSRLLTTTLEKMRAIPLHTLRIQECGVNIFSVMHAIEIVKKSLKLLDLSGNRINSSSLHALCSVLSSCQALQELKIAGCKLTEASVESILNAIGSNTASGSTAFRLDVSRNELGAKKAKGTASFIRGLKAATPLREICIRDNKFRLIDLFAVLKALKESSNLTRLSLGTVKASYNAKLMNVVVDTIKSHPVEYLDLSGDADGKNFYGKTLLPLFEAVPVLKSLKELDLRYNKIGPTQFARLCESLKRNATLMVMKIDGNSLTHDSWNALNDLLNVNSTLAAVDTPFADIAALVAAAKDKEGTNSLLLDLWKQIQDRLERRRNGQSFLHYRASLSRSEQLALKNMTRNTLFVALDNEEEDLLDVDASGSATENAIEEDTQESSASTEKETAQSKEEEEEDQESESVEEPDETSEADDTTDDDEEEAPSKPAYSAPCGGMRVMPQAPVTARIPSRESMALNRSVSQKEVTRGGQRPMTRSNSDEDLNSRSRGQSKVTTAPRRKLQRPNLQPPGSLPSPGGGRGRAPAPSPGGRGRGAAPTPGGRGRGTAPSPGRGRGGAPARTAAPVRGQAPRGGRAGAPQRGGSTAPAPAGRGRGAPSPRGGPVVGSSPAGRKPAGQFGTVYGSMPDLDDLMDEAEPAPAPVTPQVTAAVVTQVQTEKASLARPAPKASSTASNSAQFGTVYGKMPDLDDLMEEFGATPAPEQGTSTLTQAPAAHIPKKKVSPARPESPGFKMRHREVPQRQSKNFGTVYGSMPDIFDEEEEAAAAEQDLVAAGKPAVNPFLSQGPIFAGTPNRGRGRAAAQHRNQAHQQQTAGRGQAAPPGRGRGGPRGRPQQAAGAQQSQQQPTPQKQEHQQQEQAGQERETVYGIMPF